MVIDTCVFMKQPHKLSELMMFYDLVIPSTVADELDKHKESDSDNKSYQARRALRFISANIDKFEFELSDSSVNDQVSANDTRILSVCDKFKCAIATVDRGMWIRAKASGIDVVEVADDEREYYKGYREVVLDLSNEDDEKTLADFYENKTNNKFNLLINEYLIIRDKDKTIDRLKWNGKEHIQLKFPKTKELKPKNDLQYFAMDLLFDTDIPIKIIAGTYGSGKTYLAVKSSIWHVKEKGNYQSIMVVRNPVGSGKEIGFLPGDKDEKTSAFFLPFIQHLEGREFEANQLIQRGQLEKEVPYFIKGRSIGSTFLYVDEAEDLTLRDIKTIGSRIEETSCVCFTGDYKQAERGYEYNNGLLQAIEHLKGNPLVGIIVLEEDVRSTASKVFADL